MAIKTWHGYRYNDDLLQEIDDRINNAWERVADMNDRYEDLHGGIGNYTVCMLCGRIVSHDRHGFGEKCFDTIIKMLPKIASIDDNFKIAWDNYNLLKWNIYANTIKDMYIQINSKENGTPKNFKSDFKRSFFKSVTDNTSGRFSRKQVDVMLHDLHNAMMYNKNYAYLQDVDLYNKNDVIYKLNTSGYSQLKQAWDNLLQDNDVLDFIRITYKKAWQDKIFDDDININIDNE